MEVSILSQLMLTLYSVVLGAFLGVLYDLFRIIRAFMGVKYINKLTQGLERIKLPLIKNPMLKSESKKKKISESLLIFITDIIYFLITTFVMIIFIYYKNNGVVRWYIFAGTLAGLLIYYFTVGKAVISVSEYIVFILKLVFSYVFFFILYPLRALLKHLKPVILGFFKKAVKRTPKAKKQTKEASKRQEMIRIGKV